MALSAKELRRLFIDEEEFYWKVRKKISWDELHDDQRGIPIQHVSGGQLLVAYIGYSRSIDGAAYSKYPIQAIIPQIIKSCSIDAIKLGWQFKTPGKPVSIVDGKLTTATRVAKWKS